MRRLTTMTRYTFLAALVGGIMLVPPPAAFAGNAAEAELHHVDPASGRISSRPIGYLRFTEGKGGKGVDVLVQIQNMPEVQGEEPLMTESGFATYRHGLRIRATGDCNDMKATDSDAGVLPDVAELPGKSVVMYRDPNGAKRQILACGVIKKD